MLFKRRYSFWLIVILTLFVIPVSARQFIQATNCTIGADEVIDGPVLVLCENLTIDGTVEGDLIGLALRAEINGDIQGNVYLGGGSLKLNGHVQDDLHYVGLELSIRQTMPILDDTLPDEEITAETGATEEPIVTTNSSDVVIPVDGNLYALALSTVIGREAVVTGTGVVIGYQLIIRGTIENEVSFWGSAFVLEGRINDNAFATVGDPSTNGSQIETILLPLQFDLELGSAGMIISDTAVIRGELNYDGPVEGEINGRVLRGDHFTPISPVALPTLEEPDSIAIYVDQFSREASSLLSIGVLALLLVPRGFQTPIIYVRLRPFSSLTIGMLSFLISFPVVFMIFLLSVAILFLLEIVGLHGVTVAVGIVLTMVGVGGVSLFYFVAIFVARAIMAFALGRFLMRFVTYPLTRRQHAFASLFIGTSVLALAVSLPLIGWMMNALALFWGLGGIISIALNQIRTIRSMPTNTPESFSPSPFATNEQNRANIPIMPDVGAPLGRNIPIIPTLNLSRNKDQSLPIAGMDNLPKGFDMDFFDDDVPEKDE